MSDEIMKKSKALQEGLVKDVKDKLPVLKKIKAMAKLAHDIGEDTTELDAMVSTAETFAEMVVKRFDKIEKKE